jgi:CubicO group peptidase (beta-lactamase class C family)
MRLVVLTVLTVLLLPLDVPRVHAEEVHYKGRPKPPAEQPDKYKKPPADRPPAPKPPLYKPPTDRPPAPRPPDGGRHEKQPPDRHDPGTPAPPPWHPQPRFPDPPCEPEPPYDPGLPLPCPVPLPAPCPPVDEVGYPIAVNLRTALARRVHLMQIEGFAGEVVVGFDQEIEFDKADSADGYYDIGGVTEAFTAWAIYTLVDARKLSLTTTLGELFPGAPADKREITVQQLLANTSGLGNTYAADDETDRDRAVGRLLTQPLSRAPGEGFMPSEDGYVILAAAIEVASHMSYESYLLKSGVVSKKMTSTVFWGERGSGRDQVSWGKRGSSGILSTAHDLYQWASRFVDRPSYITDEIMRPRAWTDDGVGIGYGWFCSADSDAPIRWTNGTGDSDHNAIVVVYPGGAILAVTSDRYNGDVPWSERVANSLEPLLRNWTPGASQWKLYSSTSSDGAAVVDSDAR